MAREAAEQFGYIAGRCFLTLVEIMNDEQRAEAVRALRALDAEGDESARAFFDRLAQRVEDYLEEVGHAGT